MSTIVAITLLNCILLLEITLSNGLAMRATWIQAPPSTTGSMTPPRSGHVTFRTNPSANTGTSTDTSTDSDSQGKINYIFGGYAEETSGGDNGTGTGTGSSTGNVVRYATNDLWRWDDEAVEWNKCEQSGDVPGPRLVSAAALVDGRYVLMY
jgi:hypothetical protein